MRIAIAVKKNATQVSGHAGKARDWLIFEGADADRLAEPMSIRLDQAQLPHFFAGEGPHPLRGLDIIVTASAGDGYIRRMSQWGTQVLLTGESSPHAVVKKVLGGEALPPPGFDLTTTLCKLRDRFFPGH